MHYYNAPTMQGKAYTVEHNIRSISNVIYNRIMAIQSQKPRARKVETGWGGRHLIACYTYEYQTYNTHNKVEWCIQM